jgi:phosphatidylinositol dimannoside acyltransferase
VFGWAAAALVPGARRSVIRNLHRIRGEASALRDARDVLHTFGSYAGCLAEVLSNDGRDGARPPDAVVTGKHYFDEAREGGRGVVVITAHTAGWETVGPLLLKEHDKKMIFVMAAERDERARTLQDNARRRSGVEIAHVGDDPLASIGILRELRQGAIVALQIDRFSKAMRTRDVNLLGVPGKIPEGPLRLAQLSGAALLPAFCARVAYRSYVVQAFSPKTISRRATDKEIDTAAQHLATSMTAFLRAHPTQWFHFE